MTTPSRLTTVALLSILCTGCISVRVDEIRVKDDLALKAVTDTTGIISMTTSAHGEERPALLYVPNNYDASREWPLIVFLHGAGERGDDGIRQSAVGIGPAILKNPDRFPCLVFMPQCPREQWWGTIPGRGGDTKSYGHITDGIEKILEYYNIDEDRVSLTGLSMGGYGTFAYGAENADRFSAFMPICGGGSTDSAEALAKRPMWVLHGEADTVVPMERSKVMVDAIREVGGPVKFTTYPGVGHNSWDNAYSKKEGAVEWLLAQER